MKKITLFLLLISTSISFIYSQRLVILHTNDIHSKLTGFGPEKKYTPLKKDNDKTLGGFSRLASLISEEKKRNSDEVIVCDAGDFLMGTIFQALEPETGFQLNLMQKIGFDVLTLGNHEFDFGPQIIADVINSALKKDKIPEIVASQLEFSETQDQDNDLEKLFQKNIIKPYTIIEKNNLKVGIFGVLGKEAQMVSQNASPVEFSDIIRTSKKICKKLRKKENVDIIICLSHSGVVPDKNGKMTGEDIKLAKKVSDIDIIISGHTHVETKNYIKIGKTIIVQTGAYLKNLGRLEINYKNNKVNVLDFKLIPINDQIKADKKIYKKINNYKQKVNKEYFKPYNLTYSEPIAETKFTIKKYYKKNNTPSSLGNLITDAIKFYVNTNSTKTDIVLSAQGVIREDLIKGEITPADIFRISPLGRGKNDLLGYPLAKVYINGRDIKKLSELAIFAGKPGESSYLYFSGLKIHYNPKKIFLNKVEKIFVNGKEIDISRKADQLYSITANIYLLKFVKEVKKMSKGLIKIYPKDKNGNKIENINDYIIDFDTNKNGIQEGKVWLAIIEYMKTFKDTDKNGLPNIPDTYKHFKDPFINIRN